MHSISTVDADIKKCLLPESVNVLEKERKKIRESVGLNVFNCVFFNFYIIMLKLPVLVME